MSFGSLKHVLQVKKPYKTGFFAVVTVMAALCLLLLSSPMVSASTVTISDPQHVLNTSQVQSEGQNLSYPLDIYVTNNFSGTRSDFDQRVKQHITTPTKIVMAIDTGHKYLAIAGGTSVPLSNSQYQDAVNAFTSSFGNGDYTGATIASIQSLESSLSRSNSNNGNSNSTQPVNSNSGGIAGNLLGTLCCVGLVILAIAGALFFVFRRRRGFGGMGRNVPPYQQPMQPVPPYDQYNQGYPPGYGPGYPGYNQRQGMNPWAAGGLGAAAGGFLGYELGKEQGEDQARQQQEMNSGNVNNGGDFGGGAGGSFGGNDNGGFGGGAGGGFGGGDWGGGGGNDWGGGGGGGDAGGGAGGSF